MSVLVVLIDITLLISIIFLYILKETHDAAKFFFRDPETIPENERNDIEKHFFYVYLPLILLLIGKTYSGLRWWCFSKNSRKEYQTFYILSCSFYFAWFYTSIAVLTVQINKDWMSYKYIWSTIFTLGLCVFGFINIAVHMNEKDKRYFRML